jgi:hypothetical protein
VNPRTWVPKAITLPLDHQNRFAGALGRVSMQNMLPVIGSFKKKFLIHSDFTHSAATLSQHIRIVPHFAVGAGNEKNRLT